MIMRNNSSPISTPLATATYTEASLPLVWLHAPIITKILPKTVEMDHAREPVTHPCSIRSTKCHKASRRAAACACTPAPLRNPTLLTRAGVRLFRVFLGGEELRDGALSCVHLPLAGRSGLVTRRTEVSEKERHSNTQVAEG